MTEADEKVLKAVAERLRFFFSDANVRSDYFIRQRLLKSEDGFLPIETLLRFNSIKCHTTDSAMVAKAAKTVSDVLVLNKDETSIGRVVPFSMSQMDDNIPLSLYVSNLPVTEGKGQGEGEEKKTTFGKYAVSASDLRPLFEPYGTVTLVKLRFKPPESTDGDEKKRKSPKKKWNVPVGAAFVEYETAEAMQKAAAELLTKKDGEAVEPKKALELNGNKLEVITLKEKLDAKKKAQKEEKEAEDTPKKEVTEATESKKRDHNEIAEGAEEKEEKEFTIDWTPNCVISINGLPGNCDREALRDMVAKFLGVSDQDIRDKKIYADYSRGQTNGAVRFGEPSEDIAKIADKLNSGDVMVAGAKVESAKVLEGEEETKYWQDFIEFKRKQARHKREEKTAYKKRRFRK